MLETYFEMPRWFRFLFALICLAISFYLLFRRTFWIWGWAGGFMLLILAFPKPLRPTGGRKPKMQMRSQLIDDE